MLGKREFVLFIVLILAANVSSLEIRDYRSTQLSLLITKDISAKNEFGLEEGCIKNFEINSLKDWVDSNLKQKVVSVEEWVEIDGIKWPVTERKSEDYEKYSSAIFTPDDCVHRVKYSIKATINVLNDVMGNNLSSNEKYRAYLERSPNVESDSPRIMGEAETISGRTNGEIVNKVFDYVKEKIKYDEDYTTRRLGAVDALSAGKGTCDEFSNLSAALLRAKGIPARIVIGYAYDGTNWREHQWIEYYDDNKGWISADPTYYEVNTDAMHITLAKALDQNEVADLFVLSSGYHTDTSNKFFIEVIGKELFSEAKIPMILERRVSLLSKGGTAKYIELEIENDSNQSISLHFKAEPPENFELAGKDERLESIGPLETKKVEWEIKPLGNNSEIITDFCVKDDFGEACLGPEKKQGIDVERITVSRSGEEIKLNVKLANNGKSDEDFRININYPGSSIQNNFSIASKSNQVFEFTIGKKDLENVLVEITARELNYYEKLQVNELVAEEPVPAGKKAGFLEGIFLSVLKILGIKI